MQTDKIRVTSDGVGTEAALNETVKFAEYVGLDEKESMKLRLLAEETMGLVTAITNKFDADFWIERVDEKDCKIHLLAYTRMTLDKKDELIEVSSSKSNSAYSGFMGKIRELIENSVYSFEEMGELQAQYGYSPLMYGSMGMMDVDTFSATSGISAWSMEQYRQNIEDARESDDAAQEAWDELEKSIVANVADDVKVYIKGDTVEMVIEKKF